MFATIPHTQRGQCSRKSQGVRTTRTIPSNIQKVIKAQAVVSNSLICWMLESLFLVSKGSWKPRSFPLFTRIHLIWFVKVGQYMDIWNSSSKKLLFFCFSLNLFTSEYALIKKFVEGHNHSSKTMTNQKGLNIDVEITEQIYKKKGGFKNKNSVK